MGLYTLATTSEPAVGFSFTKTHCSDGKFSNFFVSKKKPQNIQSEFYLSCLKKEQVDSLVYWDVSVSQIPLHYREHYSSQNSHVVHQAQLASKVCAGSILLLGKEIKVTSCSRADPNWSQAALSPPMELEIQKEPPQCSQLTRAGGDDSFGNFNIDVNPEDLLTEETRKWPVL